jgi:hypothetical protein
VSTGLGECHFFAKPASGDRATAAAVNSDAAKKITEFFNFTLFAEFFFGTIHTKFLISIRACPG